MRVPVVVRRSDVHEWRVVTESQHAEADPIENIDHACDAGKLAKGHHSLA